MQDMQWGRSCASLNEVLHFAEFCRFERTAQHAKGISVWLVGSSAFGFVAAGSFEIVEFMSPHALF